MKKSLNNCTTNVINDSESEASTNSTNELFTSITNSISSEETNSKSIKRLCRRLSKGCNLRSQRILGELADLAVLLYINDYIELALQVCDIVKDEHFNGDYTIWTTIDQILCLKARILREAGDIDSSRQIIEFINKYRYPELYQNGVTWLTETLDLNIEAALHFNYRREAEAWRLLKIEELTAYLEAGRYPIPTEEMESMIQKLKGEIKA